MAIPDSERIAVAQAYIDALVTHRADDVPFADGCTRIEAGVKTGFSGNHLRRSLNRGPQFRLIKATTPPQYSIDRDDVRAVYDVITKPSLFGWRVCSRVDETFVIPASDGKIHHIRARVRPFVKR